MWIRIGNYNFDLFVIVGQITIFFLLLSFVACLFLSFLILIYVKTKRVIFPSLFLFLLDTLLLLAPTKTIFRLLYLNPDITDRTAVDIRNNIFETKFTKVPYTQRLLFLPHCLRHKDCTAKLTQEGILCIECGKCSIAIFKKEAEKLNYDGFFVVPGSSFVKRLIKQKKPLAVLGIGCNIEVREGITMVSSYGIAVHGVLLSKDGCIDTSVDETEVLDIMRKFE